jgi:FMN phosphatase YigB (HAD superfamily)
LCLFVDDAESNVRGARSVGIDAIQFVDAPALANELHQRQLLRAAGASLSSLLGVNALPSSHKAPDSVRCV